MSVKRNEVHDDPIKNSRHEPHGFFFPVKDKVCTNLTTSTKPTVRTIYKSFTIYADHMCSQYLNL
jgi:hypothetical protein